MKRRFAVLMSILFPIFGLISCNRHSPQTQFVEDSWRLPQPQLVINGETQELAARSTPIFLPVDAEIVFQKENDLDQTTLLFKTECHSPQDIYLSHISFKGTNRIPIASLLPVNLIHKLDFIELNASTCKIKISGRNRIGSMHTLTLPPIKFLELEKIESLHFEAPNESLSEIRANHLTGLRFHPSLEHFNRIEANLICEKFRNHRSFSNHHADSYANLIDELINGELQPAPISSPEPRSSFKRQLCRIVIRAYDDSTGLPHLLASKVFKLFYPLNETSVSGTIGIDYNRVDSDKNLLLSGMKFFEVEIENRSNVPIAFRFQQQALMVFQYITRFNDGFFHSPTHRAVVNSVLSGATRRWIKENYLVFEVAPGKKAKIEGYIGTEYICNLLALSPNEAERRPGKSLLVGFAYTFLKNPVLSQFSNWNPSSPNLSAKTIPRFTLTPFIKLSESTVSMLGKLVDENRETFLGWSPTPVWLQITGDGRKPSTKLDKLMTIGVCKN